MSWLSEATGIHISPKGFKVEPQKVLTNAASVLTGNPMLAVGNVLGAVRGGAQPTPSYNPGVSLPNMGAGGGVLSGAASGSGTGGSSGNLLNTLLQIAAGGSGVYNTIKSNQQRGKMVNQATGAYNADAPLRDAAKKKLLSPVTPDLSSVYQNDQNPFSSRFRSF